MYQLSVRRSENPRSNCTVVNLDYLSGNAVKEVAVMGDNKNTSLVGSKVVFKPAYGFSREKMLDKIERIEKPVEYTKAMSFSLTPSCHQFCQGYASLFPAAEKRNRFKYIIAGKEKIFLLTSNAVSELLLLDRTVRGKRLS